MLVGLQFAIHDHVEQVIHHDAKRVCGFIALPACLDLTLDLLELQASVLLHAFNDLLHLLLLHLGDAPVVLDPEVLDEVGLVH